MDILTYYTMASLRFALVNIWFSWFWCDNALSRRQFYPFLSYTLFSFWETTEKFQYFYMSSQLILFGLQLATLVFCFGHWYKSPNLSKNALTQDTKNTHGSIWSGPCPPLLVGPRFGCLVWTTIWRRVHPCHFGMDQTEKSESLDQTTLVCHFKPVIHTIRGKK